MGEMHASTPPDAMLRFLQMKHRADPMFSGTRSNHLFWDKSRTAQVDYCICLAIPHGGTVIIIGGGEIELVPAMEALK